MHIKIDYTIIAVFAAGLLATSGDITMTWSSPMYLKLSSNDTSVNPLGKPITTEEDGWIGSLINIGAVIGSYPFGYIADKFGRKIGLLCIAVPHIAAYIAFAFAKDVYVFYFGRLFGGLSVGGGYALLPMYIAEVSDDSNRGKLSVSLLAFWSFGNMLPYVIGPFMSVMMFNLILACFPISFFALFLMFGIETPYYWLKMGKPRKAEEALRKLRSLDPQGVERELLHIKENLKREEGGHFSDIIKNRGLRKALAISLLLIILQQLAGINAIMFYLEPIFSASGTEVSSKISSLIIGLVVFFSSFIVQFLVDRYGRKTLTNFSCVSMFFSLSMLGAFYYIRDSTTISTAPIFWMPLFALISYLVTFACGLAVMPWTISSELFPVHVKQISASATSIACWITSFLLTRFFNDITRLIGAAGTFWMFAGFSLIAAVFTVLFVPETKGKSFREIQRMLES